MPVHDWPRVDAGIFHAFHHGWMSEISRTLNGGTLPPQYYALIENGSEPVSFPVAPPEVCPMAETDMEYYRRKQNHIAIRHASGDSLVAVVEVVSPSDKASRTSLRLLVEKAAKFFKRKVHLLILDLLPPTVRDPQGIHGVIWEEIAGQGYLAPPDRPLTLVAYESVGVCAYVDPMRTGDNLRPMPLFLASDESVELPLEAMYSAAFTVMPRRWWTVLERPAN